MEEREQPGGEECVRSREGPTLYGWKLSFFSEVGCAGIIYQPATTSKDYSSMDLVLYCIIPNTFKFVVSYATRY